MASTPIRQPSFAGGEISPTMYGRTDVEKRATGLRTCRNFFISKHGAAVSRPGLRFVHACKNRLGTPKLFTFVYSPTEAYALEFGQGQPGAGFAKYVRFYKNGAILNDWGGDPYEIESPYSDEQLAELKVVQSGDVLFFTHPDVSPRTLTRSLGGTGAADGTEWAFAEISFDVPAYLDFGHPAYVQDPPPTAGTLREWNYVVTVVLEYDSGRIVETAPEPVTLMAPVAATLVPSGSVPGPPELYSIDPTTPLTILFWRIAGLLSATAGYHQVSTRIYRGRGGIFGLVGEVPGEQLEAVAGKFVDTGEEPDYTQAPPTGRNPFEVISSDGSGAVLRTEDPICVGFFEQRLVLAGTDERPGLVLFSTTNDYFNFDPRLVPLANGPVEVTLASRRREVVRWLVGLDRIILGTDSGVWVAAGAGGGPVRGDELPDVRVQGEGGAAAVDPLVIDGSLLYLRERANGVRDLAYDTDRRGYIGVDLSFFAQHLFDGHRIVQWCYARDPWGVVWAVRDNGKLLSLTYDKALNLWAWAIHDTDGDVESVCSIPTPGDAGGDDVWLIVRRTIGDTAPLGSTSLQAGSTVRYVERLDRRGWHPDSLVYAKSELAESICLDSALTYRSHTDWVGPAVFVAVGDTGVGGEWRGPPTTTIPNLEHLEGEDVSVLADGKVLGPYRVDGGQIELTIGELPIEPLPRLVHVGLRFRAELELLDIAEARERKKIVKKIVFDVEGSRGLWAGEELPAEGETPDDAKMTEWRQREVADSYAAGELATGDAEVRISSRWGKAGRAALLQWDPLPCTVLGVTRIADVGGDV